MLTSQNKKSVNSPGNKKTKVKFEILYYWIFIILTQTLLYIYRFYPVVTLLFFWEIYFFLFFFFFNTRLANDLSIFFVNGNPTFNNSPRNLSRNSPNCIILDGWLFDILCCLMTYLQGPCKDFLPVCQSRTLWEKLVSSSPIIFDNNLRITSVVKCFNLFF